MKKQILDIVYGLVALLFSIFCLVYLIPDQVRSRATAAVGPRAFPQLAALLIGAAGLALVITRVAELPDKRALFDRVNYAMNLKSLLRQAVFVAAMVLYIRLIPSLGFAVASAAFAFAMQYYFGSRTLLKNAASSIVYSLAVYVLFSRLFQVSLAPGLLPF